jgi:hypothetical protein
MECPYVNSLALGAFGLTIQYSTCIVYYIIGVSLVIPRSGDLFLRTPAAVPGFFPLLYIES